MMQLIDTGVEADVYLDGTIYKLFKSEKTGRKSAEVEDSVLRFLSAKSYPVPTPEGLFEKDNRAGVKMGFVRGFNLQEDFYNPGHGARVGKMLGNLHYILHNIASENFPKNLPHAKDLFESIANTLGLSNILSSLCDEKLVLAHGDFHPANIIVSAHGEIVIDWSHAYIAPAEADIAGTLVIFKIFQIPSDANSEERVIMQQNLVEAQRTYLREYETRIRLQRSLIEKWVRVIASLYSSSNEKANELVLGRIEILWS